MMRGRARRRVGVMQLHESNATRRGQLQLPSLVTVLSQTDNPWPGRGTTAHSSHRPHRSNIYWAVA